MKTLLLHFIIICQVFPTILSSQTLKIDSLSYKETFKKIRILGLNSTTSSSNHPPVLFMMDAQNLFDSSTSYAGEWQVDESLSKLNFVTPPVIIGIDHGGASRINELTPYTHAKYGGGGAEYLLKWITEKLIPHLNTTYNLTIANRRIAIAGSSLGGLFSHYAIFKRPDIFSHAGILSPSYWYDQQIYKDTQEAVLERGIALYLSGGTNESGDMLPNLYKMETILRKNKMVTVAVKVLQNEQHNEAQWRKTFPLFVEWWLTNN